MTSKFIIQKEEIVYKRFINVWNRQVRYPNGKVIEWDIAGHNTPYPTFAVVFPFDTKTVIIKIINSDDCFIEFYFSFIIRVCTGYQF